ncbi:hypothetical protein AA103196_2250 [Ameyamaea chiangmaiensis NBRC 103196]|uniref:Twin-arginine translocation signal domain-containing protein n=1 Tax=Ameyamaea chiangmaiensis TaxID=442969 RepID=A0A850P4U5_9PROT|nr:hypothetical protein [Ameyamaea chiangmaiensis]MBS4075490.1 hypothetical protein [Ameyamaea chiangmaiensis]NVN38978.1 hypothetical protein [Ameyamaea chiangmaiensis]GBQ69571.1 hypothetical protein AA103196_2250 [Ameyamaea chiangmaiensis NBRC 103196]
MRNPSRRCFLRALAAGSAIGVLGACTVSTSGNVTTITVNVAKVKAYGTAGLNAVSTILSVAAIASAIGAPAVAGIEAASVALSASLAAFSTAAGSSVTVTYDNTSFKTAIDSVLADLKAVASDLAAAISGANTKVGSSALSTATTALDALQTVVSVFEGLLGVVSARRVGATMTEAQALAILHVAV